MGSHRVGQDWSDLAAAAAAAAREPTLCFNFLGLCSGSSLSPAESFLFSTCLSPLGSQPHPLFLQEAFHPSAESPLSGRPRMHSDSKQHQLGRWLLHSGPWALSRQGLQSLRKKSVQVATPIDIQWISTTVMKEVTTRGQYQRVWGWIALTSPRRPCRARRSKHVKEMKRAHSTALHIWNLSERVDFF